MPRKHVEKRMSRSLGMDGFYDLVPVTRLLSPLSTRSIIRILTGITLSSLYPERFEPT